MRERGERRSTGPVLPGLLISAVIAGGVMLLDPGMTGYRFRQLTDDVGQLTGITDVDDSSYAFVTTSPAGDPVGWDRCEPIHYVVNPQGAPAGWQDVVEAGVDEVSEASGFDWTYDGTTTDRSFGPRSIDPSEPPPVLVGWADADEVPDLAGSTAGIGGSTPARAGGGVRFVTGLVVLDTATYDRMELTGDEQGQSLILAHELGHVLGLDHVEDRDELMNAEYVGQDGFGPGDRAGFAKLRELPC